MAKFIESSGGWVNLDHVVTIERIDCYKSRAYLANGESIVIFGPVDIHGADFVPVQGYRFYTFRSDRVVEFEADIIGLYVARKVGRAIAVLLDNGEIRDMDYSPDIKVEGVMLHQYNLLQLPNGLYSDTKMGYCWDSIGSFLVDMGDDLAEKTE